MTDKKISELTAGSVLSGSELVMIVQGGVTKQTTIADIMVGSSAVGGEELAGETDAMGIDFTYDDDVTKQLYISDLTTPANDYNGTAQGKLTYTSPSIKLCRQSDGVWRYGSHNLYLNSAAPANQSITVVDTGTYAIVITGSVSITLSGATTGTVTAGTTNFTAASTTLTCGSTSGSGTVAVYRTPTTGNYLATAGSVVYDLPFEWSAALASQGILVEEARTNLALQSDDLTNASWTKSNMTTAKTATGADGVANSATTLTATAGNATALQAITSGSALRISSVLIKRRTGSGNIDITQDNGSVWTTIAVSSSWQKLSSTNQTLTNPTVGIRIVTSGDEVDVMRFQHEVGGFSTSPIHTIAGTVARAIDRISIARTSIPYANAGNNSWVIETGEMPLPAGLNINANAGILTPDATNIFFQLSGNAAQVFYYDGSGFPGVAISSWASVNKIALAIEEGVASGSAILANGGSPDTSGTATFGSVTTINIGTNTTLPMNGHLRKLTLLKRRATNAELQTRTT